MLELVCFLVFLCGTVVLKTVYTSANCQRPVPSHSVSKLIMHQTCEHLGLKIFIEAEQNHDKRHPRFIELLAFSFMGKASRLNPFPLLKFWGDNLSLSLKIYYF